MLDLEGDREVYLASVALSFTLSLLYKDVELPHD